MTPRLRATGHAPERKITILVTMLASFRQIGLASFPQAASARKPARFYQNCGARQISPTGERKGKSAS
jgi:hypothetical protein